MAVKNKKAGIKKSTQSHLPIGEIRNGVVVLKEGGIRCVLKTSTINFHLKSEDEQTATISAYQSFLNSLDFPIQIVIQSRKVDLDSYFQKLQTQEEKILNPILQSQTKDYIAYLKKLVEYADIMEKEFFVVVPADPVRKNVKKSILSQFLENMSSEDSLEKVSQRYSEFSGLKETVVQRVDLVKSGLERCGLRVQELRTKELIDLYYKSYNPSIAQMEKLGDISDYNIS